MPSPKLTRRTLLGASLGAAQLALLDRLGSAGRARAEAPADAPTRLLVLYLQGGVRFYPVFVPLSDADVRTRIPGRMSANGEPIFYAPEDLVTLDGDSGGFAPLRIGANWNPADPGQRSGQYSPQGYSWLHYGLGPTTAVFHGLDMGSFAHNAAYVASMCGIPGETYRCPALVSSVANFLHRRFAATRPIPCVAINGSGTPLAPGLPAHAAPAVIPSVSALAQLFSSSSSRHRRWTGCDARTATDVPSFDGASTYEGVALTDVDALVLRRTQRLRGRSSAGSDRMLEQIHGSYAAISRTLAADVVSAVESVTPLTIPKPDHLRDVMGMFHFTFGVANRHINMRDSCEWILKLMKSNVTSAVYANLPEEYYDYHNGTSFPEAVASTRAQLDIVARMMGEMKATPSPDRPGKSLYDDTLVIVHSEFSRSWPRGPSQDDYDAWSVADDHNAVGSALVTGGSVLGNRQIGGFEQPSTLGLPVEIDDEAGLGMRTPNAADFVATIYRQFGMARGTDYFIPGEHGPIAGICP
jgi:hypothetical protein